MNNHITIPEALIKRSVNAQRYRIAVKKFVSAAFFLHPAQLGTHLFVGLAHCFFYCALLD